MKKNRSEPTAPVKNKKDHHLTKVPRGHARHASDRVVPGFWWLEGRGKVYSTRVLFGVFSHLYG